MKFDLTGMADGVAYVQLGGRLTHHDISPFGDLFRDHMGADAYAQHVLVDLSEVEWLDSSGVNWLLTCWKKFRESGGSLILHSPPPSVRDVLRVLNLHRTFKIASDAGAALEMARGVPQ